MKDALEESMGRESQFYLRKFSQSKIKNLNQIINFSKLNINLTIRFAKCSIYL